jgi:DNA ligase (NAD+)
MRWASGHRRLQPADWWFADAERWREHWYRSPLPFASDGIVLRQNSARLPNAGRPNRRTGSPPGNTPSPRPAEVRKVHFKIGRTGRITPCWN